MVTLVIVEIMQMNMPFAQNLLVWCLAINYGVLLVWFMAFRSCHAWLFGLHSRWFRISEERFVSIHYGGMAAYKIGILLFNLTPYIALRIIDVHVS